MQYILSLTLVFVLLFTTSCGFKPAYRLLDDSVCEFMAKIEIEPIPSIEGAEYYSCLKKIFPSSKKARYLISSSLNFTKDFSIIQKSSDILREAVTVKVFYKLKNIKTDKTITSGSFIRFSSFNTTFPPYTNQIRQQDVYTTLAIIAAEEVRNRIMLFVGKQSK